MKKWFVLLIALIAIFPVLALAKGKDNGQKSSPSGNNPPGLIGTVTDLQITAAGVTFTLQSDPKHSVLVATSSTTTITNSSDGSITTLANGFTVAVKGTYTASTNEVAATSVVVNNSVIGIVSNLQVVSTGDTFTLTTASSATLDIVMTATTTVKNHSDGSTATLAEGQQVMVTGKYDSSTLTFTASAIVVNDKKPVAKWFGKVASLQTTATGSTFTLQTNHGGTLSVATTSTTSVVNFSDNSAATLAKGQTVCVSGSYDDTTKVLTATSIVVKDNKAPDNKQLVAGVITSIDTANKTLVVTVKEASVQPTATTVTIAVTSTTVYKTGKGKTAAFSDLTVGATINTQGTFDATTQTLTATAICIVK